MLIAAKERRERKETGKLCGQSGRTSLATCETMTKIHLYEDFRKGSIFGKWCTPMHVDRPEAAQEAFPLKIGDRNSSNPNSEAKVKRGHHARARRRGGWKWNIPFRNLLLQDTGIYISPRFRASA